MVFNKFNRGSRTETADELGFGSKYADDSSRIINKDGTFNINKIVQYSNNLNINLNTDLSLINVYNSKLNTIFKYLFFKTFNFTNYNLLTINNIKLQILFHFLPYYNINLQVPKINTYLIN